MFFLLLENPVNRNYFLDKENLDLVFRKNIFIYLFWTEYIFSDLDFILLINLKIQIKILKNYFSPYFL
jgi:hypothetical protein